MISVNMNAFSECIIFLPIMLQERVDMVSTSAMLVDVSFLYLPWWHATS
jgi:hypothetical protein